jgi:hypothetical protein
MDHPSDVHHDECGWICSTNYECTNYLPWFPCKNSFEELRDSGQVVQTQHIQVKCGT